AKTAAEPGLREASDNDQENYFQESDECEDSDEYNSDNDILNEYENNNDNIEEDISFTFKNHYDGLQNLQSYYNEAKPYFPNKSVIITTLKQIQRDHPLMVLNSNNININFIDTQSTFTSYKEG
ncbi:4099_t:CDS:2, partial [Funneliformis mosseae]